MLLFVQTYLFCHNDAVKFNSIIMTKWVSLYKMSNHSGFICSSRRLQSSGDNQVTPVAELVEICKVLLCHSEYWHSTFYKPDIFCATQTTMPKSWRQVKAMHEAKQEKQMHHTLHADIMLCARTEPQRYTHSYQNILTIYLVIIKPASPKLKKQHIKPMLALLIHPVRHISILLCETGDHCQKC